MTNSIPTFLPDPSIANDLPNPLGTAAPAIPPADFAGLLAGAAPQVGSVPAPGIPLADAWPVAPGFPVAVATTAEATTSREEGAVTRDLPAWRDGQLPAWLAGPARPANCFAPATAKPVEPAIQGADAPDAAATLPTRAEQEEAMAMLAVLFPELPPSVPVVLPSAAPAPALPSGSVVADRTLLPMGQPGLAEPVALAAAPRGPGPDSILSSAPGDRARPTIAAPESEGPVTPPASTWSDRATEAVRIRTPLDHARDAVSPPVDFPDQGGSLPVGDGPRTPASEVARTSVEPASSAEMNRPELSMPPAPGSTERVASFGVLGVVVARADGVRLAGRGQPVVTAAAGGEAAGENSAARPPAAELRASPANHAAGKKVLTSFAQRLAEDAADHGTTAANAEANMNPRPFPSLAPAAGLKSAEPLPVAFRDETPAANAPRVLAAVLEVAEAQESARLRPAPAVHLRLQVAGETVGLRVELRDDAVQTHFTAVSPELRTALTREWQTARNDSPDGAPRLLDPIFPAPADRGGASAAGQDAASHQQSQARSWSFPWDAPIAPFSRRARGTVMPETAAGPAADERLLSALA